jgi:dolichol-phosphate mannosyltransferase
MENLKTLIPNIIETYSNSHVLVIDDFSDDSTEKLMESFQTDYPARIYYICRKSSPSYAESLCEGLRFAYENKFQKVVQMDADGSHAVKDINLLVQSNANLAIGSRYCSESKVIGVPLLRQVISMIGNVYITLIWRTSTRDKTNGFRCFDEWALANLSDFKSKSKGFAVQIEVMDHLLQKKDTLKISEIPITFQFRNLGESKFDSGKLFEALRIATMLAIRRSQR